MGLGTSHNQTALLLNEALGIRERRKEEEMKTTKERESHRTKKAKSMDMLASFFEL